MSEELLPCPFCGGHASITRKDVEPQGDPYYGSKVEDFVQCDDCGCVLFDQYFHEGFSSNEDATKAWNTRTVQAAPSDRERRLEEALNRIVELDVRGDDESNNCEAWAMHLEEAVEIARTALADAPDKPHYAALSPEPWGGPEGGGGRMTTREAIYKSALEHIRDGSDAVCTDCGWIGLSFALDEQYLSCPECESEATRTGADEIAAYALAQGEKGEG